MVDKEIKKSIQSEIANSTFVFALTSASALLFGGGVSGMTSPGASLFITKCTRVRHEEYCLPLTSHIATHGGLRFTHTHIHTSLRICTQEFLLQEIKLNQCICGFICIQRN